MQNQLSSLADLEVKNSPTKMQRYPLPSPPSSPPSSPLLLGSPFQVKQDKFQKKFKNIASNANLKAASKSDVTEEARKVLELFMQHSLMREGITYSSDVPTQSEQEYFDECPYMYLHSNESYYGNTPNINTNPCAPEECSLDEPDYAEPAEPDDGESEEFEQIPETQEDIDAANKHSFVKKTNSTSSQGSLIYRFANNTASEKHALTDQTQLLRLKNKSLVFKAKALDDSSSSSTEDYEYTEGYLVRRKKKSFFKWASERLRQSFRRSHKVQVGDAAADSIQTPTDRSDKMAKKWTHSKLKFSFKRSGSEKSPPNPNDASKLRVSALSESEASLAQFQSFGDTGRISGRRIKSPVPWKRNEIKQWTPAPQQDPTNKEKSFFGGFLHSIRKNTKKRKDNDSVRQRSRSADNLVIHPLSKEYAELLQRFTKAKDYDWNSVQGQIQQSPAKESVCSALPQDESCSPVHRLVKSNEGEDDVDGGGVHDLRGHHKKHCPLNVVAKPFHERTAVEKEELYEKIAEQLAAIADQYNFESPRSSKSLSSPTPHTHSRSHSNSAPSHSETEEGATGPAPIIPGMTTAGLSDHQLQHQLDILQSSSPGQEVPMLSDLVRNASYSNFKQIFNENIGNEPGWQQIAMMFRLTQTAVQLAGFGTATALQIKEMTLKYFEDKFAGWIIGQGGWESVVEDTENDSELD